MPQVVDLRSDTVTRPDDAMRRAMAEAEVGDDVFGEDPTVRRLEERAAEMLGTEAALFVPSGTQGNQIALHLHGTPGEEVVCAEKSHVILYEMGAMAVISGLLPRPVPADGGILDPQVLAAAIPPEAPYRSRCGVLVVENSFNISGGRVYDRPRLDAVLAVAAERGLATHLDGARVFNAAASLGVDVRELARGFDSVNFCLSKGLGAPVGSCLCGTADFVAEAWRVRKMLGGGMRQAGVLAAAGLLALEHGPEHLVRDHENARFLAAGIAEIDGMEIDVETVETNIVIFRVADAASVVSALGDAGVQAIAIDRDEIRFVTHRDVDRAGMERTLAVLRDLA